MPRTKISEFSATPASNTDIDSIFIGEGMAPSNVNDAIRELMAQLKDFQTGAVGDSFNGPVGSTTAATGAFTTLTTTGTINNLTVGRGAGAVATNTAVGASALAANTTGFQNTAGGVNALAVNTIGNASTAFGYNALALSTGDANNAFGRLAMPATTSGTNNAAFGNNTLQANTTGSYNVALGANALNANTTASENTAVGYQAAYSNTTGSPVSAFGYQSLYANTTGIRNTSIGYKSLMANTTGGENSTSGHAALFSNTTGSNNTAMGSQALLSNTTASNNTAVGYQAGFSNTTGTGNTFLGNQAGYSVTTSNGQTFIGQGAGSSKTTGGNNTFVGTSAGGSATTGTGNTFIGVNDSTNGCGYAITTGSKNTIIGGYTGNQGGLDIRTASNYIVLSDGDGTPKWYSDSTDRFYVSNLASSNCVFRAVQNTSSLEMQANGQSGYFNMSGTSSIFWRMGAGTTTRMELTNAGALYNSTGTYGTISDVKLKENIVNATPKLADIMQVRVVNYNKIGETKKELGVIAQELETIFPALIDDIEDKDKDGNVLGTTTKHVKYSIFVPMLIKAMQEQQAIIESLKARLDAANL